MAQADVLLDVGHNPAGAWALRAAVSHLDKGQPLTLVFGCLKDKPIAELAQILFPLVWPRGCVAARLTAECFGGRSDWPPRSSLAAR